MVSGLVTGLSILTVILLAGIITVIAVAATQPQEKKAPLHPCTAIINASTLINLDDPKVETCTISGYEYFYLGKFGDQYDYLVSSNTTPPQTVCQLGCSSFQDGKCQGTVIGGKSAQDRYDQCIQQLITNYEGKCIPPAPIAFRGIVPYYPYQPGPCPKT